MSLKKDVLNYLCAHSGEYVSGEALAKQFNKSRAGVWKAIRSLQNEGYVIDALTNRGYCMRDDNDVLSADEIRQYIDFDCDVVYYDSIDSTNTQAKRLITDGMDRVTLVCAGEQTSGRGRQGKSFYSPKNSGIYLSLVTHPMLSLKDSVSITTASSVAVCRAVEKFTGIVPEIKWVNDVYINGSKICGILTEAVSDFESGTVTSVIIGIGVNITTSDFPSDVKNATSLGVKVKRALLIAQIANELWKVSQGSFDDVIDYYRSHSMVIGKDIIFYQNSVKHFAKAVGIDDNGGLVVLDENSNYTTLSSGEITVRVNSSEE